MKNRNKPESRQAISGEKTPVTRHWSLVTLFLTLACAGCGIQPIISEGNYLTYDHPFTDAAAQAVLQNAGKTCADRKRDAVKTNSVCSLTQCTTHYQCVLKGGGTGYVK